MALLGFGLREVRLASVLAATTPMAPATAVALLALAGSLCLAGLPGCRRPGVAQAVLAYLIPSAVAAWVLGQFLVAGMAGASAAEVISGGAGGPLWPMSPIAAALLVVMAAALLLKAGAPGRLWMETLVFWLHLATFLSSAVLVTAYGFGHPLNYTGPVFPVAFPTAVCILLLAAGGLAGTDGRVFPARLVLGDSLRAKLLRAV
ncbi:MAG: hypothetical protein ACYC8T_14585, partial [Myxococcaceae bacterium]